MRRVTLGSWQTLKTVRQTPCKREYSFPTGANQLSKLVHPGRIFDCQKINRKGDESDLQKAVSLGLQVVSLESKTSS